MAYLVSLILISGGGGGRDDISKSFIVALSDSPPPQLAKTLPRCGHSTSQKKDIFELNDGHNKYYLVQIN